jgi:hypothetical protein
MKIGTQGHALYYRAGIREFTAFDGGKRGRPV